MKELGAEPDAALRGQIVHRSLHEFFGAFPDELPADAEARLIEIADGHFDRLGRSPIVEAFWRPAFRRFARWFAATEPERRDGVARILTEVQGALELPSGFRLSARADRIDVAEDGSAVIYDYKTGKPPKPNAGREALRAAASARSGDRCRRRLRRPRPSPRQRPHLYQRLGPQRGRAKRAMRQRPPPPTLPRWRSTS